MVEAIHSSNKQNFFLPPVWIDHAPLDVVTRLVGQHFREVSCCVNENIATDRRQHVEARNRLNDRLQALQFSERKAYINQIARVILRAARI